MDQAPLYKQLDVGDRTLNAAADNANLRSLMQQTYSAFVCPSDTGPERNTDQRVPRGDTSGNNNCTSGCVALSKSNYVAANNSRNLERQNWNGFMGRVHPTGNCNNCTARATRERDVTDGLSNTILLGERAWELNGTRLQAAVIFGTNGDSENNNNQGLVYTMAAGQWSINDTCGNCDRGFSSVHTGGAQFLLGDGRVQFVSENIDHNPNNAINSIYERLIAIADGQVVGDF